MPCRPVRVCTVVQVRCLNVRGLQQPHEAQYEDFIHHSGELSEVILQLLLAVLRPGVRHGHS